MKFYTLDKVDIVDEIPVKFCQTGHIRTWEDKINLQFMSNSLTKTSLVRLSVLQLKIFVDLSNIKTAIGKIIFAKKKHHKTWIEQKIKGLNGLEEKVFFIWWCLVSFYHQEATPLIRVLKLSLTIYHWGIKYTLGLAVMSRLYVRSQSHEMLVIIKTVHKLRSKSY